MGACGACLLHRRLVLGELLDLVREGCGEHYCPLGALAWSHVEHPVFFVEDDVLHLAVQDLLQTWRCQSRPGVPSVSLPQ